MAYLIYQGKRINTNNKSVFLDMTIPRTGLVAEWLFNNNFDDTSDNSNTGTPVGSPTFTTDRKGNANSALNLNGVDQWVTLSNPAILGTTNTFSISVWVNMQVTGILRHSIYGEFDAGVSYRNNLYLSNNRAQMDQFTPGGGIFNSGPFNYFTIGWAHLCYIRSGSYQAFYIDAQLSAENNSAENFTGSTPDEAVIGKRAGLSDSEFGGYMDSLRLYDRALSYNEIFNLARE